MIPVNDLCHVVTGDVTNNTIMSLHCSLLCAVVIYDASMLLLGSALFPDVVNCMQTDNLELKKLVYLYLMNYAKSQPDMAIMAVNTFVKVSQKFRA